MQSEIEHNIEMVNNMHDINSKIECYIYSDVNFKGLENLNIKGLESSASVGKLTNKNIKFTELIQNESAFTQRSKSKIRANKSVEALKKQLYLPCKVIYYLTNSFLNFFKQDDIIDFKLAEVINGHKENKKLCSLFKRRSQSIYMFGNKRIYLKWESSKLWGIYYRTELIKIVYYFS